MSLEPPSEEDREAVLAEVERLPREYLEASREFERVFQLVLEGKQNSEAVNALMNAFNAHKLSLDRYVAAWTKAAGEN